MRTFLKKIFDSVVYSSPVVNKIFRNLNKLVAPLTPFRLRPFGTISLNTRGGINFKLATNETSSVTRALFWNGPDKFEYTPIFEQLIVSCQSFIDVGANIGYYSVLAAKANSNIQVHAFEPSRGPLLFLEKNRVLNKVQKNIAIHRIALSDKPGTIEFFEIQNAANTNTKANISGVGTTKKMFETQQNSIVTKVPCETLDTMVNQFNNLPIDLIKIDTEGTENIILQGASETIQSHKPIIICETLYHQIEKEIETIMKKHGYLFFNHVQGRLIKTETLSRETDNGVRDCFMVHPDKVNLIARFI